MFRGSESQRVTDSGLDAVQTARIWEANKGDGKVELRGHEHVVEVAVFAPIAAYSAIRELAGITVRLSRSGALFFKSLTTDLFDDDSP